MRRHRFSERVAIAAVFVVSVCLSLVVCGHGVLMGNAPLRCYKLIITGVY